MNINVGVRPIGFSGQLILVNTGLWINKMINLDIVDEKIAMYHNNNDGLLNMMFQSTKLERLKLKLYIFLI